MAAGVPMVSQVSYCHSHFLLQEELDIAHGKGRHIPRGDDNGPQAPSECARAHISTVAADMIS